MRISGGTAKGRRLRVPRSARPASERVRQAVFSALGTSIDGAHVLDLYCGSGAYGLEALSRGAATSVLVDSDADAAATARANVDAAGFGDRARVRREKVDRYVRRADGPFDIAFLDPPYGEIDALGPVLGALGSAMSPGGRAVVETTSRSGGYEAPAGWTVEADRRYGDTRVLTLVREGT